MPQGINYLAVLVAGIAIFAVGGLWYMVLFGKQWVALQGKTVEQMQAENAGAGAGQYIQVFIVGLVTAYAIAVIENHFGNQPLTLMRGAMVGAFCWLLAGTTSYGTALFSNKPKALWAIDTGMNLVSMVVAGIILALWR